MGFGSNSEDIVLQFGPRSERFVALDKKGVDSLHNNVEDLPPKAKKSGYQNRIEEGTLGMLILKNLHGGPQHGYGMGQAIRVTSREGLQGETGSLYPALHRLERRG